MGTISVVKSCAGLALAAWVCIGVSISAAQAQNLGGATIGAVTAEQLKTVLSAADLNPNMMADGRTGAPVAAGKAGEFDFYVRAFSCSGAPASCETLVFFANFKLDRSVTENDYRIINSFNESQVFGRAYVMEGSNEVGVDYVIELGGGVSEAHLSQNIARWADVIAAFVSKFQGGDPTS